MPRSDHRKSLAALVLFATGCGGSIGPFVTDIAWRNDGSLEVTRCMVDITGTGNMTTYEVNSCRRQIISPPPKLTQPPSAATVYVPVRPPVPPSPDAGPLGHPD